LFEYLKQSIDFAVALGCKNLVFGSPKNRNINPEQEEIAIEYFSEIGKYATEKNTIFALEPNPIIYGTNFINTTNQALDFVKECNVEGLKVNFDLGTVIYNEEDLSIIENNLQWINHVHISEPYLEIIQKRSLHHELASILRKEGYKNYISIEMKGGSELEEIKDIIEYTQDVFKN
jgi:sugar phosphate isomerase/epimerase